MIRNLLLLRFIGQKRECVFRRDALMKHRSLLPLSLAIAAFAFTGQQKDPGLSVTSWSPGPRRNEYEGAKDFASLAILNYVRPARHDCRIGRRTLRHYSQPMFFQRYRLPGRQAPDPAKQRSLFPDEP